jgi:hypothetical protein
MSQPKEAAMWTSRLAWIAWPAFMSACVLELVVFALVDPLELQWSGHHLGWSRQAAYTVGFFFFWATGLLTAALTTLLAGNAPKVGDCAVPPGERPEGCPQR